MANLLHIDASPREERSHSRRMTKQFVETWKQFQPQDKIIYRDIGRNPIPHVTEAWIATHLFVGLIMIAAIATSSAFAPAMQKGKVWARYTHISINIVLLLFFGWQSITGLQIVQEILTGA